MEKILTIVIPTYNMEKYLRRCLDSLIIDEEGMKLLEVLVINDGSKDSSSAIAHEYQDKFPDTFRVIDKENGNYGSCINRGLKEAKGKFLKILDSDDWYDNKNFRILLTEIHNRINENIDTFYTNFTYHDFYKNIKTEYRFKSILFNTIYESDTLDFKDVNDFFMLKMYSVCVRTDLLREIDLSLDTGISYTDNEFMYYPYRHFYKVVFLDLNVYQYFIGREGQTINTKITDKHLDNVYIIANRIVKDYINIADTIRCANVKNVLLRMAVGRCVAYFDQALSVKETENISDKIKRLYKLMSQNH